MAYKAFIHTRMNDYMHICINICMFTYVYLLMYAIYLSDKITIASLIMPPVITMSNNPICNCA